jgi:UDP-N-acetylglucosamine 2-epimerase (non-hydrolysing)
MNALKTRKRPITVSLGTNVLVGRDPEKLRFELSRVLSGSAKKGTIPPLWDGHAGERIAALLAG